MKISHKQITLLVSFALFLFVFIVLGIPFTRWWFNGGDDFGGLLLAFMHDRWQDLLLFFRDGHINAQSMGPSNALVSSERPSFFGAYYRPFYCIFITMQYWLFGTNGYLFFLCNVFFHAINTTLIFVMAQYFTTLWPAIISALFFAFHPQVAYRFGAIVNLHYYVNVMLMLTSLLLFKQYLDLPKMRYAISAHLCFAIAVLTRESSIVFPGIIFLGTYLYEHKNQAPSIAHFFKNFWHSFTRTAGFWGIAIAFLGLRLYLYPINFLAPVAKSVPLQAKLQELLLFIYDAFWLSWLPWGKPLLRGGLLLIICLMCIYFFVTNTKKFHIMCLALCAIAMMWPAYIGNYSPRYIYEALPFIVLIFVFLFHYRRYDRKILKPIGITLLSCAALLLMIFTVTSFKHREAKMDVTARAIKALVNDPQTCGRVLCILSCPADGQGDNPADIIRVLRKDIITPIYCDNTCALIQAVSHIVTPTKWYNKVSEYYDQNYITITPVPGGFRYISHAPEKIHFFVSQEKPSLGKKTVNAKKHINNSDVMYDFTVIINPEYMQTNPLFIAWDYEKKKYHII